VFERTMQALGVCDPEAHAADLGLVQDFRGEELDDDRLLEIPERSPRLIV
jgi:hypothetical protein